MTGERLAEIRQLLDTLRSIHGWNSVRLSALAINDLLAENERLACECGEAHDLMRSFIRTAPLGVRNAINNLLRRHGQLKAAKG